jgi:AcrR family transcriptional regulator
MERKIIDAFLELCLEKNSRKVAVKEICERAGIARSTFYQHYEDVGQLLASLEERTLGDIDEIVKLLPYVDFAQIAKNGIFPPFREIYCYIYDNMALFRVLFMDPAYFFRHVDHTREYCLEKLHDSAEAEFWATFLAGGTYYNVLHCIEGGARKSPEELARMQTRAMSIMFDIALGEGVSAI